jgi:chromosome segregation ATPase
MRVYFTCFNVDQSFARNFKFPKSKGDGFFTVKYMFAAFDKEAEAGEFYVEFEERVWEHKLIEALEAAGATQVIPQTFAHNDGNESASDALLRVWNLSDRTGLCYFQGECQEALQTKTSAKLKESKKKRVASEFDEKTAAAIKQSLSDIGETNKQSLAGIGNVSGKVEIIDEKVSDIGENVVSINSQIKEMIDLKKKNEDLEKALTHKRKECDRIEYEKGRKTEEVNKLQKVISSRDEMLRQTRKFALEQSIQIDSKEREYDLKEREWATLREQLSQECDLKKRECATLREQLSLSRRLTEAVNKLDSFHEAYEVKIKADQ